MPDRSPDGRRHFQPRQRGELFGVGDLRADGGAPALECAAGLKTGSAGRGAGDPGGHLRRRRRGLAAQSESGGGAVRLRRLLPENGDSVEGMKAVVLAAGKSTRITPVSGGLPKPLIRIAGETILGRNLVWLASEGIRDIWINLHYRPEEIREAIGDGSRFGVSVRYVHEPELLGTAGAVRNLAAEWKDTILVVYGDSLVRLDLGAMFRTHRAHAPVATVALFDRRKHSHTAIAGGLVETT